VWRIAYSRWYVPNTVLCKHTHIHHRNDHYQTICCAVVTVRGFLTIHWPVQSFVSTPLQSYSMPINYSAVHLHL